jgi:hypothetical protein
VSRLCALTTHRMGRVPDVAEPMPPMLAKAVAPHYNFTDGITGQRVYNWRCSCGKAFMSTGRWSGFVVMRT